MNTAELGAPFRRSLRHCLFGATPTDRRNNLRFLAFTLCWAAVFVGTGLVQKYMAPPNPWSWIVAFLPAIPALLALAAYVRFLKEADEMVRTIQFQGLAYGFGAGVLVKFGVQLPADLANAVHMDFGLLAMMLAWSIGQAVAARRYR